MSTWLLVLAIAALGCGGSQKALTTGAPATITVLDPGAEPRTTLVYTPQLHVPEHVEVSQKLRIATSLTNTVLENGRSGMDLPTVVSKLRLEAKSITASGALITCEIADASMLDDVTDPAVRKRMAPQVSTLHGMRGSWRRSSSGIVTERTTSSSPTPTMADTGCELLAVPFPDVPIGVGARWQARETRSSMGVRWQEVTVFTLRSLEGSTAGIDFEATGHAGSQALSVQPRATTTLKDASVRRSGHVVVPLRRLSSTGDARSVGRMTILMTDHALSIKAENELELVTIVKVLD